MNPTINGVVGRVPAQKLEASFRISLVCSSSRFSFRNGVNSFRSTDDKPADAGAPKRDPASRASLIHNLNVS